jgi:hypothetical protein
MRGAFHNSNLPADDGTDHYRHYFHHCYDYNYVFRFNHYYRPNHDHNRTPEYHYLRNHDHDNSAAYHDDIYRTPCYNDIYPADNEHNAGKSNLSISGQSGGRSIFRFLRIMSRLQRTGRSRAAVMGVPRNAGHLFRGNAVQ